MHTTLYHNHLLTRLDHSLFQLQGGELQHAARLSALYALHHQEPALEDHDHAAPSSEPGTTRPDKHGRVFLEPCKT